MRQSTSCGITLDIPFLKKNSFADRSISYVVAQYWNDLPECIRNAKDIKKFKSLLKTHFLHQHFLHNNISQYHFTMYIKTSFVKQCRR